MNVLHIIPSMDPLAGGPSAAMVGLAEAQQHAGLVVRVLTCAPPNTDRRLIDRLRDSGVLVTPLSHPGGVLSCPPEMRSALGKQIGDCEIVHLHALWEPLQHFAAVHARKLKKPYLFRPCGMLDPWSLAQRWLKKKLYLALRLSRDLNGAAALHFTTPCERDAVAPLGLAPEPLVVPNGIDLAEYADLPPLGAFRRSQPQLGNDPYLLFLSRLHYKKGVDRLIRAFSESGLQNTRLVIAGTGDASYTASLKELARSTGVDTRVHFVGMLHGREKLAAYRDADLFVLLSHQENFGNVVVESLACGTPVLLSDQVAIGGEVAAAGIGQTVDSGDSASQWLSRVTQPGYWGDEISERSRSYVAHSYDWKAIAAIWSRHYARLTDSNPIGGRD